MSKLPKDKRDKIILVCMATAVACGVLWFFIIKAQNATLAAARQQVSKAQDDLARGQALAKTQAGGLEEYEAASQALRERELGMAAPNDMYSWFIEKLNAFQAGTKVEIPQFGRELPSEVGCFSKFPYRSALFTVRGTATFHDFGKFLADFENAFPYIRVQNIDLEPPSGEQAGRGDHTASASSTDSRDKLGFKMELLTLVRPTAP